MLVLAMQVQKMEVLVRHRLMEHQFDVEFDFWKCLCYRNLIRMLQILGSGSPSTNLKNPADDLIQEMFMLRTDLII